MGLERWLNGLNLYEWTESLLPDFVLAFAFFTSLTYAVISKQFDKQRPAIAMSVSIGLALSTGLTWWERANDFSIRNLGPIAVGFAILILAFVMYQSIRKVGGSWAGAGIALGSTILIAQLLKLSVPIAPEVIQTVTLAALVFGLLAFFSHNQGHFRPIPSIASKLPAIRHDMSDLYRDRTLSDQLRRKMRNVRKESALLTERPQQASDVLVQLKRMLPAEGYLTEKMAQLRAKAHNVRNGHIAKLEETQNYFANLPISLKKQAAAELSRRYKEVAIDAHLERLDRAVAENEQRIRNLTQQAEACAANYDHKGLVKHLKAAENLQRHNSNLFKLIGQTENKLSAIARKITDEVK